MPSQTEALESKRKYVQSLTRSAILQDLLLDELDFPEQLEETEHTRPKDKQALLRLHFHIVLPAIKDAAVYDQIYARAS